MDVLRPADARFQHAAAPDRHVESRAKIVDRAGRGKAADAPDLDIDDPRRIGHQRMARIGGRTDAFIQTEGGQKMRLHFRVVQNIVKGQRLFDIVQREFVHRLEPRQIGHPVIGIGVNGQLDFGKLDPDGGQQVQIMPALDLELDAPVSLGEVAVHDVEEPIDPKQPLLGTRKVPHVFDPRTGQARPMLQPNDATAQAKAAIARGADPKAVNARLRSMGLPEVQ